MKSVVILASVSTLLLASCGHRPPILCDSARLDGTHSDYVDQLRDIERDLFKKLDQKKMDLTPAQKLIGRRNKLSTDVDNMYSRAKAECTELRLCADQKKKNKIPNYCVQQSGEWGKAWHDFQKLDGELKKLQSSVDKLQLKELKKEEKKAQKPKLRTSPKCQQIGNTVYTECFDEYADELAAQKAAEEKKKKSNKKD